MGVWWVLRIFSGLTEEKKMQDIFGILLMVTGTALGLLFQDPVICRFTENNQCSVALGKQLHLQLPPGDTYQLKFKDKTNKESFILKSRKIQNNFTTWQFLDNNNTVILTRAERSDSRTYTLDVFDVNGNNKGSYSLQLNVEAEVSSVHVSYSCLSPGVKKVSCSADGDNLHFNWTSDSNTLPQLEKGNRTLTLDEHHRGNVTCSVFNHVSRGHSTTELKQCPETTTATMSTPRFTRPSHGTSSTVSQNATNSTTVKPQTSHTLSPELLKLLLIILSSVCVVLILVSILACYVYRRRQSQNKQATSQDGGELVYAKVTHIPKGGTEARPNASLAQDEEVEYATVVTSTSKRKQKKKEDEVQYGELVFNTAAKNKHETPKVQDDCVYSHVQHVR